MVVPFPETCYCNAMQNLVSTRDLERTSIPYPDAIINGLAFDGGLYVPERYTHTLDTETLRGLQNKPYTEIFRTVKGMFVGDTVPADVQTEIATAAFTPEKFPHTQDGNIVPLTELDTGLYLQDLSGGPTAAFKDMALQPLALEIKYQLEIRNAYLDMLGATSGDTGSASEAAFRGLSRVRLAMLSPQTGMSRFQQAQMGELSGDNIANYSIDGSFDPCQELVKNIKKLDNFNKLGAVNSINWGRITSQVAYYVAGYLQACDGEIGKQVDFVVPTGNFGNVLAGHIARNMGLPIRKLVIATNENNVLHRLVQTGEYVKRPSQITTSPSMDIAEASNFERTLYDLLDGDPRMVRRFMTIFKATGATALTHVGLRSNALKTAGFESGTSSHEERLEAIRWACKQGTVIDPHTADGVHVARAYRARHPSDTTPTVVMSTAKPVKFEPTIQKALGFVPRREPRFQGLEERVTGGFTKLPNNLDVVQASLREFFSMN
jgi:threonine synthase